MVFVVGCPRSGTYLLSSILNGSGQVAIPTETHFIPHFWHFRKLAGRLETPAARRRIIKAIFIFLKIWMARAEEERDVKAVIRHSLLIIEKKTEKIVISSKNFSEIVNHLFLSYAEAKGAKIAGDKSAFYDSVPLDKIDMASGGKGLFIHVIRDARDVCVSWHRISVGPKTISEAAKKWSQHVETKKTWGLQHPDRYFELRYEDLLEYPKHTLRRVCAFLNIRYTNSLFKFHKLAYAKDLSKSSTHKLLSRPLNPANREKWKRNLTRKEIQKIETIAGQVLKDAGYKLAVVGRSLQSDLLEANHKLSIHGVRLYLKNLLPIFAIVASWLSFPLDQVCNSKIWLGLEKWVTRAWGNKKG